MVEAKKKRLTLQLKNYKKFHKNLSMDFRED